MVVDWTRTAEQGWRRTGTMLVRDFVFRDFEHGMRFLEQVAERGEDHLRRPAMAIDTNRVRLTIANPHNAGITLAELRLAAKVNAVVEGFFAP